MVATDSIPWRKLSAESIAIVASILLAFAIDAWWEERQDRKLEQIALAALLDDFRSSRDELADRLEFLQQSRDAFRDFWNATPEQIGNLPEAEVAQIPTHLSTAATFDAYLGTLEAMVADGRMALVSSPEVRELLSRWIKRVSDTQEDTMLLLTSSIRVTNALEPYGGPFISRRLEGTGPPALEIFSSASPSLVAQLRRDSSFVGVARSHQRLISFYVRELRNLEKLLDELVHVLEEEVS